jgi:hypothetical protein
LLLQSPFSLANVAFASRHQWLLCGTTRYDRSYRPQRTMAAMAFTTISDVLTNDGTLIAPADMPYQIALAVEKTRRK